MDELSRIDKLLRNQDFTVRGYDETSTEVMAMCLCALENLVVVVSDLSSDTSRIFAGAFASEIGLQDYSRENSIWEKAILELMPEEQREEKYRGELRFFHFLRHIPKHKRSHYYLATKLKFRTPAGKQIDVLHRMYYIYDTDGETIRYGVCTYGPSTFDFHGTSMAIDSVTGATEDLTSTDGCRILSNRELQVLRLIGKGMKSSEIAELLTISKHTVSRHRQEIIAKLKVKNSVEALRAAKSLGLM